MFQAGDRVKVLTPDGYAAGVVVRVLPQWYWAECQYVVEFDDLGLGRHAFPAPCEFKAE